MANKSNYFPRRSSHFKNYKVILSGRGSLLVGAIIRRKGIINSENKKVLIDLLIYVFLPANIIGSFNIKFNLEIFIKFMLVFLFACITQGVCLFYSKVLYRKDEERKRKVLQYATICSNAAFLGLPIIEGIYGVEAVMYASIAMVPQRIVMWSSGLTCFTKAETSLKVFKRVALHPCIIAVYIGILYMISPFKFPVSLEYTIKTLGN